MVRGGGKGGKGEREGGGKGGEREGDQDGASSSSVARGFNKLVVVVVEMLLCMELKLVNT